MAWTSMHFAVGMACSGAAAGAVCAVTRRGWRWIPALMTVGGFWALVPDLPRLWREDFPWLPFAAALGNIHFEHRLHRLGDLFFFHHWLDAPPHLERQYALHGLILMILLYNAAVALLMVLERKQRLSPGNRMWRAHGGQIGRAHV